MDDAYHLETPASGAAVSRAYKKGEDLELRKYSEILKTDSLIHNFSKDRVFFQVVEFLEDEEIL